MLLRVPWGYAAVLAPCLAYFAGLVVTTSAATLCTYCPGVCAREQSTWLWHALAPLRRFSYVVHCLDMAAPALVIASVFGVLGYGITYLAIQYSRETFLAQGLGGVDLLKVALVPEGAPPPRIPESLGLPCAAIYLLLLLLFIPFRYFGPHAYSVRSPGLHQDLATFLSALLTIYSGTLLGFVDDVLDIRWRYKLPIPLLSSIPMLVVYVASGGATSVVVPAWPPFLRTVLQSTSVELGVLYYVYMMLLATFCTNCINILAGINGVEVGQALVIAASVCVNDLLYLDLRSTVVHAWYRTPMAPTPWQAQSELASRHLFSLYLLLPFIGTSAALLTWNRYPSRVFVGDTYCYFAGMVLVAAGILGHYSKTLLLFFLPQIANFVVSAPQLAAMVPCPRHRVPWVDRRTGLLFPSCVRLRDDQNRYTHWILSLLTSLRWVAPVYDTQGKVVGTTNLTLLNAILVARGTRPAPVAPTPAAHARDPSLPTGAVPGTLHMSERQLWYYVMAIQLAGSCVAFGVRYWLAPAVFPIVD